MAKILRSDRLFLLATILLICVGFFIFSSASLGLLAREGISYSMVALKQMILLLTGIGVMFVFAQKDYTFWRRYALPIFAFGLVITAMVFVPHIGFGHNGAHRWISVGSFTFQPAEFLKIGAVIYLAAWLSKYRDKINTIKYGLVPFLVVSGLAGILLLKQPDTGTFLVVFAALFGMYIVAGAKWSHVASVITACFIGLAIIAFFRPYVMARITTFLDPSADALGSGYQIQQALIAVGSGSFLGRGFGQSIQKFNFLPEPIGDSIYAVAAEEFGFVGSSILILLFLFFSLRGFKIASAAKDNFGSLLAVGIVILIMSQALINIGSMLGLLPLTGVPLSFISHGGTALLFTLAETGIILNISKGMKKTA